MTSDSKGSRREDFASSPDFAASGSSGDSTGLAGLGALAGLSLADFAGRFAAGAAWFPVCGEALPAGAGDADFAPTGVAGLACARSPGAAAASKIPTRVITERIDRSFPLRVSQPA